MSIPILCRHSRLVPIEELAENPRNPNRHPTGQIELLTKVIRENGWRAPIVVSKRSGFIVKGHGRYEAAKLLGLKECPVEFQDYATEAEEWRDMIADNRIAELSIIDNVALSGLLDGIQAGGMNINAAGFSESAFDELRQKVHGAPPPQVPPRIDGPSPLGAKLVIGMYVIKLTQEEQNNWLQKLYADHGRDDAVIALEIKRRLGL